MILNSTFSWHTLTRTKMYRWRISVILKRGEFIGYVEALTEDAAIKEVVERFGITDEERQSRLVAQRVK